LQEVINERRSSIQEPPCKYIAIEEIKKRPYQRRQTIPNPISQPSLALGLSTEEARIDFLIPLGRAPVKQLQSLAHGIPIVLGNPVAYLFAILVYKIVTELTNFSVDDYMLVDGAVFTVPQAMSKEAQNPGRIIAAPDPFPHPDQAPFDIETILFGIASNHLGNFPLEIVRQPFVRIEKKHPFRLNR